MDIEQFLDATLKCRLDPKITLSKKSLNFSITSILNRSYELFTVKGFSLDSDPAHLLTILFYLRL